MAKERKKRLRVKTLMALYIGEEFKPGPFSYTECLLDTHWVIMGNFYKKISAGLHVQLSPRPWALPELGLHSALPHTGPYSSKACSL
jgi:hypothetical protein